MAKIQITGIEVNVRSGPSLDFNIVGKARQGEEYPWLHTATDIKDPIYKWHATNKGWLRSDLSKVVADGATGVLSGSAGLFWPRPCDGSVTWDFKPAEGHRGIDIWSDPPSLIYGIPGATVHRTFHCIECGSEPNKQAELGNFSKERGYGFGNYVVLHKDGYYVMYAHLQSIYVEPGQVLDQVFWSTAIGKMGQSGNADGWHLHLEVRTNDKFDTSTNGLVNPRKVFAI
jgi:hypothetical protein